LSISTSKALRIDGMEPVEALTPAKVFDARWTMALLGEAMNRLNREYLAQGKTKTFEALRVFLDPINSKELPTYEDVADRLKISVGSVKTLIHRLRKQYTALFGRRLTARFKIQRRWTQSCTSAAKL